MKKIPIFFAFNNDYVEPAAVAFYSLLSKTKSNIFYNMFVLHSDISIKKQNLLYSIINRFNNAKLEFVDTNRFFDKFWQNGTFSNQSSKSTFTSDTLVRCFASRFFPQYDKIIYSDVDVIFADDISELYDINIEKNYFAGVKNAFMKSENNELEHLSSKYYEMLKDSYIAGGILVFNLKKIREDSLENEMLDIINDSNIYKKWPDQDIINIVAEKKITFIPLNYICYPYLVDLITRPNFTSHYTRDELYDSIINPKIIHFAAAKPWNSNPNFANIWWSIFNYLELKQTHIFNHEDTEIARKVRKYKKLFKITLTLTIILLILLILVFYYSSFNIQT